MSSIPLKNQTAILTGGAAGLGLALAKRLVDVGVNTCLFDTHQGNLENAKKALGDLCSIAVVDVTDVDATTKEVDAIAARFGSIHMLVNCAGITGKTNLKSHEVDPKDFDRVLAINVRGTLLMCQAVLPHMLKSNYGRILNIASIAGKEGNAGM
ncbi:MAG: SDR family NAD(P)-dependent oxidoreductase, partial [Chthoniobacterales bacterium]